MNDDKGGEVLERHLALRYAPSGARPALAALFALDARLGDILRSTTDPMIGQMRLTWWHDALTALDHATAQAEPILTDAQALILPRNIAGSELAALVEGWEALLDDQPAPVYADRRGGALFALAGRIVGAAQTDPLAAGGQGWALADLARHQRDREAAGAAADMARPLLRRAAAVPWSRAARSLGAQVHLARADLSVALDTPIAHGSPRRVARMAWHRLTGR